MDRASLILRFITIFLATRNIIYAEPFKEPFTKSLELAENSISSTSQGQIQQVQLSEKNIHQPSITPSALTINQNSLSIEPVTKLSLFPIQSSSDDIETLFDLDVNSSSKSFLSDKSTFLSSKEELVKSILVHIPKYFTSLYLFTIKVDLLYEQNSTSNNISEEVIIDSNLTFNGAKLVTSIKNIAYFKLFTNQTGPALVKIMTYMRVFIFHIFIHSPVASVIMEAKKVF